MKTRLMVWFSLEDDMVKAHALKAMSPAPNPIAMHDDNFLMFNLVDESHQAIITVLNAVWPNWVDGDQWWLKWKERDQS